MDYSERKKSFLNRQIMPGEEAIHAQHLSQEKKCFNDIHKFEQRFHKDLCYFSESEFDEYAIDYIYAYSYMSKYFKISAIKRYLKWCRQQGYISRAQEVFHPVYHMSDDSNASILAIRNEMFASYDHFNDFICSVIPSDELISMKMEMAAFTLIYYGFQRDEAALIERSELRLENDILYIRDKVIDNKNAIMYLMQVVNQSCFLGHFKIGQRYYGELKYCDNKYLLRKSITNQRNAIEDEPIVTQTFTKMSNRISKHIKYSVENSNKKFSTIQLWKSGRFYELYQLEQKEGMHSVYSNCCKVFGVSEDDSQRSRRVQEYVTWRSAFHENQD